MLVLFATEVLEGREEGRESLYVPSIQTCDRTLLSKKNRCPCCGHVHYFIRRITPNSS